MRSCFLSSHLPVFLLLTACASVQTHEEWERVKASAFERTGAEIKWEQTEEDVKAVQAEAGTLLSDGLSEEDAVKIALLNNRKLQASFEEIGVAKADLVQAGLFTNPGLSAVFRFPFEGGGTSIEGEALMNIADFWQMPIRKKAASSRLETVMLQISEEILDTAAEARKAHLERIALTSLRDEVKRIKEEAEKFRDHLIYRQKFGYSNDLDIYTADASAAEQELELARLERELKAAALRLNRVLGLSPGQTDYEMTGSLSEEFTPLPDADGMIAYSLSMKPDILIAKMKVEGSRRVLELEKKRIFDNVEAGAAYAKEGNENVLGTALDIRLPVFDQNQAQIAKAEYRVRQAEKELQAEEGVVREEVSSLLEQLSLTRKEADLIRDKILPAREGAVEYAEKYFNAMQLNMLYLLETKRSLFETQRRFLEVLQEQRRLEIELERVLGGAMPVVKAGKR